jgi:hypothetical protein
VRSKLLVNCGTLPLSPSLRPGEPAPVDESERSRLDAVREAASACSPGDDGAAATPARIVSSLSALAAAASVAAFV